MQTYGLRAAFCAPLQHGSIADAAAGDFDRSNSQRFLVYTYLYLSPDAAFGAAVLAGNPRAFRLNDTGLYSKSTIKTILRTFVDGLAKRWIG